MKSIIAWFGTCQQCQTKKIENSPKQSEKCKNLKLDPNVIKATFKSLEACRKGFEFMFKELKSFPITI